MGRGFARYRLLALLAFAASAGSCGKLQSNGLPYDGISEDIANEHPGVTIPLILPIDGPIAVTRLELWDANTNTYLRELVDGDTLVAESAHTSEFAIRAVTNPDLVGSVVFKLDGEITRYENGAPYFSDGNSAVTGDIYAQWLREGTHTIVATPTSDSNGAGTVGTAITVRFTVVAP